MRKNVIALALLAVSVSAGAQEAGKAPWEEYEKLVASSKQVAKLESTLLGDSVDLATGALSFSATDLSLKGNNQLPVALTRSFAVTNRDDQDDRNDLPFGDWDLDLPRIVGTYASTWPSNRCSGSGVPPTQSVGGASFQANEYWDAIKLDMPGGGPLLLPVAAVDKPTDGNTYRWVTSGWTHLRCLMSISNGAGEGIGEGFLALTSDGTKYWFNWMAQYYEPPLKKKDPQYPNPNRFLYRAVNALYPTRIEDRFGNYVTLTYSNAWNQPVKLGSINSSDGRSIALTYNASGQVKDATDGTRKWLYTYSYPTAWKPTLAAVTLEGASSEKWTINFSALSDASVNYNESRDPGDFNRNCFNPGNVIEPKTATGTIMHPSGAQGAFTVAVRRHGRSNVPAICAPYTTPQNDPNDDTAYYAINWDSLSLVSKTLTGPGIASQTWTYSYQSNVSWFYPGGGSIPVCTSGDCSVPQCLSDACAGISATTVTAPGSKWSRYIFGNSYRYNEGKLLSVEEGGSATDILRTTDQDYELAQSGQPFPTPIGTGVNPRGDWFTSAYLRPQRRQDVVQDGTSFVNQVEAFDGYARPLRVKRSSSLAGGGGTGPGMGVPALQTPSSSTTGSYAVTWSSVSTATRYELDRRVDGGVWTTVHNASATTWSASNQSSGNYDYRVRACNASGCGAYSGVESTVVLRPPGAAPTVTAPGTDPDGAFTVTWSSVSGATEYEVEQRKDGGAWVQIHAGAGNSKAVSGLTNGTYDYRARACNLGGCSGYSVADTTVVTIPPGSAPVLNLQTTAGPHQSFNVTWSSVSGATSYELQLDDGGGWSTVYTGSSLYQTRSHAFEGNYFYRVRACNAGGCGPYSGSKKIIVVSGSGGCGENPCPIAPPDDPEEGGGL